MTHKPGLKVPTPAVVEETNKHGSQEVTDQQRVILKSIKGKLLRAAHYEDYRNSGDLCTSRASEETDPTHMTPPHSFPPATGQQRPVIAPLQPSIHDPLYAPRSFYPTPFHP
ncbi:hypothetical protein EYF80_003198 [Liparis tanakae]|uniref:Uncharacterized protein n=1 Tax=Liparis tanakae TaxID=230148 RepID=A0A4Z2J9R7_9TELE|nr:hypothetical protein EYF80_003198 [Liparis tanakae]